MKKIYHYISSLKVTCWLTGILLLSLSSCKKSIDVGPPATLLATSNVFTSNGTAEGVISGLYAKMASPGGIYNGASSITIRQGLAADELVNYATSAIVPNGFYQNALSSQYPYYWQEIFSELFTCNSAINGLSNATSLTPAIQQQLLGEAEFARGYIFFNAVNLYGDVPLALGTDPAVNNVISRSPAATVLKQVITDLTAAQAALPDGKYISLAGTTTTDRSLPNKQAASALLARVYLYMKDWKNAEAQSTNVIGSSPYILEPNLNNVFLKTSRETIWQLQSISSTSANADAQVLVLTAAPNGISSQYPLSNSLVSAFENGDTRFNNWVGQLQANGTTYYYAYKYKQNLVASANAITEYPVMFRLAEQYLIRAEARAEQNDLVNAAADLNAVRARAGLPATTAATQTDLLNAIYHERQVELFTEFGHRWFDLKRTGRLDGVMGIVSPAKGGSWSSYKALIPIPQSEIIINPKLVQNPGY